MPYCGLPSFSVLACLTPFGELVGMTKQPREIIRTVISKLMNPFPSQFAERKL